MNGIDQDFAVEGTARFSWGGTGRTTVGHRSCCSIKIVFRLLQLAVIEMSSSTDWT
jgi:hypothetical protein